MTLPWESFESSGIKNSSVSEFISIFGILTSDFSDFNEIWESLLDRSVNNLGSGVTFICSASRPFVQNFCLIFPINFRPRDPIEASAGGVDVPGNIWFSTGVDSGSFYGDGQIIRVFRRN